MRYRISQLIGTALYVSLIFAVLFDPTEAALGSSLIALPQFALATAEILGNVTWLIGLLYFFVTILFLALLVFRDFREEYVALVVKGGAAKGFKAKWHRFFSVPFFAIMAVIAIGSGFWFTGFFWLTGIWLANAVLVDVRKNSETYKAWKAEQ